MKTKVSQLSISALCIVMWVVCGCGQKQAASGPVEGTLKMDGLSIDQQIEKVRNDKTIPENYKETYINSLKAKAGKT